VARIEDLTEEPEYLSAGPPERFSSPRWSVFRVPALGLVAVALAALGGYWVGTVHTRSGQTAGLGEVIAVPGGRPSGEGFGFGSIWVTTWSPRGGPGQPTNPSPGHVVRYDPATRQVVAMIEVGPGPLAAQPGFGSMWVTNAEDGTVSRIDPRRNDVVATIKVGPVPYLIAPAGGGMWVATQAAAVKIDPVTEKVVQRSPYPHPPGKPPSTAGVALDANAHGVWVSTAFGTVLRLRPSDGRRIDTIPVQPVPRSSPGMVAIDGNNVWVSNYPIRGRAGPGAGTEQYGPSNRLVDISAATGKIIARVPTAGYPVESFLPDHGTLLMVGVDYANHASELIRTDWPYQVVTYARPLGGDSFNVVNTHGYLWIPSWDDRTLQILPNTVGLPNNSHPGR
jgi:YVTN family beta-propeller protein